VRHFADRLLGSPEVYRHKEREAEQSVNFVTCHDGFTLNDLVSYNHKHNEANGEDNRDGGDDNRSWNCGPEGITDDPEIEKLRNRQIKNFLTATLLSLGMPMMIMGDEVRRTQLGNNNAYCHNDETVWFDWTLLGKHPDVLRYAKLLIARRLLRDIGPERQRMTLTQLISEGFKGWHGVRLNKPDWGDDSHSIALSAHLPKEGLHVFFIFNAYWEPLDFELPPLKSEDNRCWRRWIDTHLDPPQDITEWQNSAVVSDFTYRIGPRSVAVLWASSEKDLVIRDVSVRAAPHGKPPQ
jgi:glycogen operon protein